MELKCLLNIRYKFNSVGFIVYFKYLLTIVLFKEYKNLTQ